MNHFAIGAALGVSPENTAEENMARSRRVWSNRPEDADHRASVLRMMRAQSMEFSELNVEYGYRYESAAVVPDGTPPPAPIDDIRVYEPSTRPGAPLPHAWIDDEDGDRRPIKDLVAPGRFLLIAGEDGGAWCEAANELAADADLPLDCGAHRPPRRRPLRPALRVAAPARDPERRRDPRAPRPLHRLASADGGRRPARGARRRARPDPRSSGRHPARAGRLRRHVMTAQSLDVDVAIVGYGPVGQALAALLGRAGHRVVVFERFQEIYRLPRAVHLDHEIMRLLQSLGLAEVLAEEMVPVHDYQWFGADGELLLRFDADGAGAIGVGAGLHVLPARARGAIDRHACVPAGVTVSEDGSPRAWRTRATEVRADASAGRAEEEAGQLASDR